MAVYDEYAKRNRIGMGVAIKRRQAETIFGLGMQYSESSSEQILEVGPGDGYIADLSQASKKRYLAVEGSDAVANILKARDFNVIKGYVPPLPTDVGSGYRCCFMLHVIEHMRTATDAAQIVSEIHDVLVPGGSLVIACPDYSRWGSHFYDCDYTHSYPVTGRRLRQLLQDQGFDIAHHTVYVGPIFGFKGLPLSWLAKAMYWPVLDDVIGPKPLKDAWNRGFLTFLPNLLTVATRRVV